MRLSDLRDVPDREPAPWRRWIGAVAICGAGVVAIAASWNATAPSATVPASGTSIERGRYLANEVAMCVQCHSPRDAAGRLIPGREFRGAPMPVSSPYSRATFAPSTPDIRSLSRFSGTAVARLLQTGIARDGNPPKLPMPPFRMSPEDAESIVQYLASLD